MYMKMSGQHWVANVNLTSALFTCKQLVHVHVCVSVCVVHLMMEIKIAILFVFCAKADFTQNSAV